MTGWERKTKEQEGEGGEGGEGGLINLVKSRVHPERRKKGG